MDWQARKQRLTLIWYSIFPGAFVAITLGIGWIARDGGLAMNLDPDPLAIVPWIFGAAIVFSAIATMTLRRILPQRMHSNQASNSPDAQVQAMTFLLLGAADAPAVIGIAFYVMTLADWLGAAIILYSFIAGFAFKPDFDKLRERLLLAADQRT